MGDIVNICFIFVSLQEEFECTGIESPVNQIRELERSCIVATIQTDCIVLGDVGHVGDGVVAGALSEEDMEH